MDTGFLNSSGGHPPMSPFGVAYMRHLRDNQDPAQGIAQAKQAALDAQQNANKGVAEGTIQNSGWSNPETMGVPDTAIPIRAATSEENQQMGNAIGEHLQTAGTMMELVGLGLVNPAALSMGAAASSLGYLIEKKGGWVADKLGRLTVDKEKLGEVQPDPGQKYELNGKDDPSNMTY